MSGSSSGSAFSDESYLENTLGFDVCPIAPLMISNGRMHGEWEYAAVVSATEVNNVYQCWKSKHLNYFNYIHTGFLGESVEKIEKWAEIIKDAIKANPDAIYVCDPIIGNSEARFLSYKCIKVLSDCILPLADVLTPNSEELKHLKITDKDLEDEEDVFKACDMLHAKGIGSVILKHVKISPTAAANYLSISKDDEKTVYKVEYEEFPTIFSGCGDFFSALFTGWLEREKGNKKAAFEIASSIVHEVLRATYENAVEVVGIGNAIPSELSEIHYIQKRKTIEHPEKVLKAKLIRSAGERQN